MVAVRSSRGFGRQQIVLGSFCLPRTYPFEQRLADAAAAGIDGVGLFMAEWERLITEGMSIDSLAVALDRHGLALAELDLINLGATGDYAARAQRFVDGALVLAERFEVRYLQAIAPAVSGDRAVADPASFEQVADEYGRLCDRAADVGLLVGIEYVPYTTVKTLADAVALVAAVGRFNAGVCVDVWHHRRGGSADVLAGTIAPEQVLAVQVNDGPRLAAEPNYKIDCLVNRQAPGTGELDCADLLQQLVELGVDVPWTLEVCRDADSDHTTHVATCAAGLRSVVSGTGPGGRSPSAASG
jgi:sugar phosphate isomerase/epimerase